MKNNITEIVCILDKSGSMAGYETDTVGGFNATLAEQKELDGKALISTVLFSNESRVIHDRVDVKTIEPMSEKDFRVGGCTALLDAIGGAIRHISKVHTYIRPEDVPEHTVFVIMTDGFENASHRYSSDEVKAMIKEKEALGWEFIFLAANIDAVETASRIGIRSDRAANFSQDGEGFAMSYAAANCAIRTLRCDCSLEESGWRNELDKTEKKRKKKTDTND